MIRGLATPHESSVQYYNVVCPRGHRVRGQRTEGYQALRCPACGEGVFVLPASPLPDPGPRRSSTGASDRRRAERRAAPRTVEEGPIELVEAPEATVEVADEVAPVDVEISWEDDAALEPDPPPSAPATAEPPASPGRSKRMRRASTRRSTSQSPRPDASGLEVVSRGRRMRRNPYWIFALVAVLVVGTVMLRVWRNRRQALPQIAELGRVEGIPALEAGDFDRAHQLLAPAGKAVLALDDQVEGADRIRQAAEEVALYVDLAGASLEEMLDEAARASSPEGWNTRFNAVYRGRGVVFDTRIAAVPEGTSRRYEIEYLVMPAEESNSFREGGARPERFAKVDLSGFELFELAGPKVGDHVLFGGRLASFGYDAESRGWLVRLEPRSGLFVQFHKALESLGWPEADAAVGAASQEAFP